MGDNNRAERGGGSLFYSRGVHRWVVMLSLPNTGGEKRRRLKRTFKTRGEAASFLSEGTTSSPPTAETVPVTVEILLDGWWTWIKRRGDAGQLAPNTVDGYSHAAVHVREAFSHRVAGEVTVDEVERFLANQARFHSGRYVVLQHNVLNQAYRWGQRNRLLTWNPAQLSTCPARLEHKPGVTLTVEQAQRLLHASQGNELHALWTVMLGAGLRPGEAMGLTWPCVQLDVEPAVIHVRAYLRKGPEGMFLGAPKTTRSARSLDVPAFVAEALEAHRNGCQSPTEGPWRDLVFATGNGTPYGHRNLRRALRRLCVDAELPPLTLYDLRRTAGSLLVDAGVHLECVADLLGHSSVATTRRHYVRAVRPTVPHAVGLDAVLGGG